MDFRKLKEQQWADERFKDAGSMLEEDYKKKHSNKKFYSITCSSRQYMTKTIQEASKDGICLDYCCGSGQTTLGIAASASKVYGIDISPEGIKIATTKAAERGLNKKVEFVVMDAEHTDFPDKHFDFILCSGVLHHLDIEKAYKELRRILKPSGLVLCGEPLRYNPIFQLYRKITPHLRTEWERDHILGMEEIRMSKKFFRTLDIRFFHLVSLAAVPFRSTAVFNSALKICEKVDSLFLRVPYVQRLAWQAIFKLTKPID